MVGSLPVMSRVVVGYVPKPEGEAALERAVTEAGLRRASLVVINAARRREGMVEADLDSVRERLASSGLTVEVREVTGGFEAAEDIIAAADPTDLIVIGLRRRTPLGKLILGSSAQRILLDAPCPVLTVKPG